jgi:hypothetical protein
MPEADDYTPEAYDKKYLTAEVLLANMGGTLQKGTAMRCKRDSDGNPVGLDTREYEVEFQDGATDTFTANTFYLSWAASLYALWIGSRMILTDVLVF